MSCVPEPTERARLRRQAALDAERGAGERNRLGQFATPAGLAEQIVHAALQVHGPGPVRLLEPAVGSGAFFSALVRARHAGGVASARGFEVDTRFADTARELWAESGLRVDEADFTRLDPAGPAAEKATLVLANPPYVRHHHLARSRKVELQRRAEAALGEPVSGLAGLYVHFVLAAHAWMAPGAVGAWLVPGEWMDVNYGAALRHYLCRRVELLRVHRFASDEVQFSDALVSSSVVLLRRGPPAARTELTVGDLSRPARSTVVSPRELDGARKWTPFFRGAVRSFAAPEVTLGDLLHVRRGIATGGNAFFVRPRAEFRALGVADAFLRPVLPPSRHLPGDEIGRADDGYPDVADPLALLHCSLGEAEVRERWPALWAYLEGDAGQRVRLGYLARLRRPWYAQERRPPAPIVATYMRRGPPRFFWNRSDATATNAYLLLSPRPALAEAFARSPDATREVAGFLAGADPDELLGHGRVYAGGLHKLEPRELGRLDATKLAQRLGVRPSR